MKLGIWMEPEVASVGSAIYRSHPDWFHRQGGRDVTKGGPHDEDRRTLHLGIPAVVDHVLTTVLSVVDSWEADWLKWDFNTNVFEGDDRPEFGGLVGHVNGLYEVWSRLKAARPKLVIENCAGGGGRLDIGAVLKTDVTWMSDMVSPLNTLAIRFGLSRAFAPRFLNSWLVQWPPGDARSGVLEVMSPDPLAGPDVLFGSHVGMMGVFGISAAIDTWDDDRLEVVRDQISLYRSLRDVILRGDCYRFTAAPVREQWDWGCMGFFEPLGRRGIVFAFRLLSDETALSVKVPEGWSSSECMVRAGDAKAQMSENVLEVRIRERMRSCVVELTRPEPSP